MKGGVVIFKRIISLSISIVICFLFIMPVNAKSISDNMVQPCYEIVNKAKSSLSVTGMNITCESLFEGNFDFKQVVVKQTLFQVSDNSMIEVNGASWSETFSTKIAVFTNTKSNLSKGTYCLLSEFTVTTKTGKVETIEVYSDNKII